MGFHQCWILWTNTKDEKLMINLGWCVPNWMSSSSAERRNADVTSSTRSNTQSGFAPLTGFTWHQVFVPCVCSILLWKTKKAPFRAETREQRPLRCDDHVVESRELCYRTCERGRTIFFTGTCIYSGATSELTKLAKLIKLANITGQPQTTFCFSRMKLVPLWIWS